MKDAATPDEKDMPADVYQRCYDIRKRSKCGAVPSPKEMGFLKDCHKRYPRQYAAMSERIFEDTRPFGSIG